MIRKLRLAYFRRHESLVLDFLAGINCPKGRNEVGKSTIFEGIAYAFYGSKALRSPLADCVTWGHKDTELKASVEYEADGKLYTFTRSKAGAEVLVDGAVYVTGQNEVSEFAAQLIGAPLTVAQRLMFANQGNLRGALQEGPKAVATQIENLCNFDIFDQIIERMQEKLVLGAPGIFEARLEKAETALAAAPIPVRADTSALAEEIRSQEDHGVQAFNALEGLKDAAKSAYSNWQNAENAQRMHQTVAINLKKHEQALALHQEQLKSVETKAADMPSPDEIAQVKKALTDAKNNSDRLKSYQEIQTLMATYPEVFWEGSAQELEITLANQRIAHDKLKEQISKAITKREVAQAKLVTTETCPTCGQDCTHAPKVVENNQAQQAIIDQANGFLKGAEAQYKALASEIDMMEAIRKAALPYTQAAHLPGVVADLAFVPPKLAWDGQIPDNNDQTTEIQGRLAALEEREITARRAQGQAEVLRQAVSDDLGAITAAREQLDQYPAVENADELRRAANAASAKVTEAENQVRGVRDRIAELQRQIDRADTDFAAAVEARQCLANEVIQSKCDLERLYFNNALLKKVRSIRPLVADKLWNQVLSAVSTMFSTMRGEQSVVTKTKDGFKVNDQSVESLSGSTLDLLGLAIRIALVKTFLPACPFIILDEPMAACDNDRSLSLLAFLASCGFKQCLLVSHEDMVDTISDHLIDLNS